MQYYKIFFLDCVNDFQLLRLWSISVGWMHECGALLQLYCQGKNSSTVRKTCPSTMWSTANLTWTGPWSDLVLQGEWPTPNCLSHNTAQILWKMSKCNTLASQEGPWFFNKWTHRPKTEEEFTLKPFYSGMCWKIYCCLINACCGKFLDHSVLQTVILNTPLLVQWKVLDQPPRESTERPYTWVRQWHQGHDLAVVPPPTYGVLLRRCRLIHSEWYHRMSYLSLGHLPFLSLLQLWTVWVIRYTLRCTSLCTMASCATTRDILIHHLYSLSEEWNISCWKHYRFLTTWWRGSW
jgi:hypothetical protein